MQTSNIHRSTTKTGAKMEIDHDVEQNTIIIKDGIKWQFWLMKFSLICTVINSLLFTFVALTPRQLTWFGFFWIFLGLFSAGLLIYILLRKTGKDKIKLSEIAALEEKSLFGRKTHRLNLINGRSRNFLHLKNQKEIDELYDFFQDLGIKAV